MTETPVDEAHIFATLRATGRSVAAIAAATGYGERHVAARLRLLELDEASLRRVAAGLISADAASAAVRRVLAARRRQAPAGHPPARPIGLPPDGAYAGVDDTVDAIHRYERTLR